MAWRLFAVMAGLLVMTTARAAPGDLDPSFGAAGIIVGDVEPLVASRPAAALQPDGKLIVAGTVAGPSGSVSWRIRRYNADGSSDLAFGTNGSVIVSLGAPLSSGPEKDVPTDIALLPDGRFVVAGNALGICGGGGCDQAGGFARFHPDGSLDSSLGGTGKQFSGGDAVAIQSDGRILTYRNMSSIRVQQQPMLERHNVDGSRDPSFVASVGCYGNGTFRLTHDDKIVVVTTLSFSPNDYGFCVAQLNADGTPDAGFGSQGVTSVVPGTDARLGDFFIDAGGGITGGGFSATPLLFRLLPDGTVDPHFGSAGIARMDAGIGAVAGDCHGRTVLARPSAAQDDFVVTRASSDGSIDATLTARAPPVPPDVLAYGVGRLLVRPDGRILALAVQALPGPEFGYRTQILQYQGDSPCASVMAIEYYNAAWNHYFVTAAPAEIATLDGGAFEGAWTRTGATFDVWPQPNVATYPMCRFFSTAFTPKSSHFYTPFPAECASVKTTTGWQFEGVAFHVQVPTGYGTGNGSCPSGTVALYRAYNGEMGGAPNHRYTTDATTLSSMIAQGWTFEGEANTRVFACVPP